MGFLCDTSVRLTQSLSVWHITNLAKRLRSVVRLRSLWDTRQKGKCLLNFTSAFSLQFNRLVTVKQVSSYQKRN